MKYLLLLVMVLITLISCQPKTNTHNDSYVHAQVDSIVGSRMMDINARAMEDLDQRISIEVKAKADSIIASRKNRMHPLKDTVHHP